MENEPALRWTKGTKWPFQADRPLFQVTPEGPWDLAWVVNSRGLADWYGYPPDEPVPDFYGELVGGRRVLFEVKGKDAIEKAMSHQLPAGVRILRTLGHPVQRLAISVSKLRRSEGWVQGKDGLLRRADLTDTPADIEGMTIVLEQRWRNR